jgi:hypothetical protein
VTDELPDAPWALAGECFVGLARRRRPVELPAGLHAMAGLPRMVRVTSYTDSPVGPFLELVVAEPAHLGLRPGWATVSMAVSNQEARLAGRRSWGYPTELATLVWHGDGRSRELVWEERELVIRAELREPPLPILLPVLGLQRRADGPVVVPGRLRGIARYARVDVTVPEGNGALSLLAGRHPGVAISGLKLLRRPSRLPSGLLTTLSAPLRAPEPGLPIDGAATRASTLTSRAEPVECVTPGA